MKRTEAIAWLEIMKEDAIFEQYDALKMAIEALQTAEINCVHCPHYYETEDDIGVHSHCGNHGRLIDADALIEDFNKLNEWLDIDEEEEIVSLINNAPTISAEAVSEDTQTERTGRWYIIEYEFFTCDQCGEYVPSYAESTSEAKEMLNNGDYPNYCPNCGTRMKGEENEID